MKSRLIQLLVLFSVTGSLFAQSPTIVRPPENQTTLIYWTAAFKVTAIGSAPMSYQWSFKGAPVAGATNPIYTVQSLTTTAGNYSVTVSNAFGSVTSSTVKLTCFNWNGGVPQVPAGDYLATFPLSDGQWLEYFTGFGPQIATNVACVPSWDSGALLVDSTNSAVLAYDCTEYDSYGDNWPFLTPQYGSIDGWFSPLWSSGTGPGCAGRLIEIGSQGGTNDWWCLFVNSNGTQLTFSAATNGVATTYLTAPISWYSNEWYHFALLFSTNGSSLFIDNNLVTNGLPVTVVPGSNTMAGPFRIGSDANGQNQAQGEFAIVNSYDYPVENFMVTFDYGDFWPLAAAWTNGTGQQQEQGAGMGSTGSGLTLSGGTQGSGDSGQPGPMDTFLCANGGQIYFTNVTCTPGSGGSGPTISFGIAGGSSGVTNHLYCSTNVASAFTNVSWQWLQFVFACDTVTLSNQPAGGAYYVVGGPKDSLGIGLPDWWQWTYFGGLGVNPTNNCPGGTGLNNLQEYYLGLNPTINQIAQQASRVNYSYDSADWLRSVSGTEAGSITPEAEGNINQVSQ